MASIEAPVLAPRASGTAGDRAALWNRPAIKPPAGRISNFDNPENHDHEIIIISAIFLSLSVLAVVMRFFVWRTEKRIEKRLGWAGLMCILALLSSIVHITLTLVSLKIGFGRHLWDIRTVELTRQRSRQMLQIYTTHTVGIGFGKLFVLFLYLRFFEVMRRTRIMIWIGIIFNILVTFAFLGVIIARAKICNGSRYRIAFCADVNKTTVYQTAINVILDLYILLIPLQQVYRLKISTRRKLGVGAIFGMGFLACIASGVRFGWSVKNLHDVDHFWSMVLITELGIAEMNIIIIAPCLIFMPAFIKKSKSGFSSLRSRLTSSRNTSRSSINKDVSHVSIVQVESHDRVREQESLELKFLTEANDTNTLNMPQASYQPTKSNMDAHYP